ncbi:MAG: purine-nucleoside phosphorylase [Spirochaetales bacterium]|nr:purine-nucleoside phosphorylase [Spirochaetales bacterium]
MSTHISAKPGEIAERVLLPGDPLRAKFIAETFLEDVQCYTSVRNMLGFTGNYKGKTVSVQGTGMGAPSISIYVNELIQFYGARRLIRVGTCGSVDPELRLKDIVIAQAAATDSGMSRSRLGQYGISFPAIASFNLIKDAVTAANHLDYPVRICTTFSSDQFYDDLAEQKYELLLRYGIPCVEMECAELFTLGSRFDVETLGILTVSDMINDEKACSAEEREKAFTKMMQIALDAI